VCSALILPKYIHTGYPNIMFQSEVLKECTYGFLTIGYRFYKWPEWKVRREHKYYVISNVYSLYVIFSWL